MLLQDGALSNGAGELTAENFEAMMKIQLRGYIQVQLLLTGRKAITRYPCFITHAPYAM